MKCLHCGRENEFFLCDDCLDEEILNRVFDEVFQYRPEICTNPYLAEYVSSCENSFDRLNCIPEILKRFDSVAAEYYYCRYFRRCRAPQFEERALGYLAAHPLLERKPQWVLCDLLDYYERDDFIKPAQWCEKIRATDGLCCETYLRAARYYAYIGNYDIADGLTNQASASSGRCLSLSRETAMERIEKQRADIRRYRTVKPYWPTTEERRRAIAMFYDERGIQYPRIELKPDKVRECDFEQIIECENSNLKEYCAFWCNEAMGVKKIGSIYQIAAAKVRDGEIIGEFQSYVRPLDDTAARKNAAKKAGISLEEISAAEDVDLVMRRFFGFVGDAVLVSTDALGNQAKLLMRAARYSGMKRIKNEFLDILDFAADTDAVFRSPEHNTREYLLSVFSIAEGENALEKAGNNVKLFDRLQHYEAKR